MKFEWDEDKAASNLAKHDVSFDDAVLVFFDPLALLEEDRVDQGEQRWSMMGAVDDGLLLIVIHVYREHDGVERIRLISARQAEPNERKKYERENG